MEQSAQEIRAAGGELLGVAVTATFSQQQFAKDLQLSYPLLSDWGGAVSDSWGVRYDVWKGHEGLAKRSLFVVDPTMTVQFAWVTDDASTLPDYDEAVAVLHQISTQETP